MLNSVRIACEQVCGVARQVHINRDRLEAYSASLSIVRPPIPRADECDQFFGSVEDMVAFILTLDAINFGSGYFPHLQKRGKLSGYFTVASWLRDRFQANGALSPETLRSMTMEDCAETFGQDLHDPVRSELMSLFAQALNDLGTFVESFDGSFLRVVEAAGKSSERLAMSVSKMPLFRDVATYHGSEVPFFKRAQITVADLAIRFGFQGAGEFTDLDRLTIFADNVVPNVLRVDGVLEYSPALAERIDRGELLPAGSDEEIEIRAAAVYTAELLVALLRRRDVTITAMMLDYVLWNRGRAPKYKASPRHRTRSVYY